MFADDNRELLNCEVCFYRDDKRGSIYRTLSENIGYLMIKYGLNLKDLSMLSGVHPSSLRSYIGRCEKFADIGIWNLYRIAEVFHVTVNDLLDPDLQTDERIPIRRGARGGCPKITF